MMGKSKGQMFLIMGILIILFLITIRLVIQPVQSIANADSFDSANLRKEFGSVQKFSKVNSTIIANNLINFSNFTKNRLTERNIDFTAFYTSSFVQNVSTGVQTNFTVTVGNFLGTAISNVNVSASNSTSLHGFSFISEITNTNSTTINITFVQSPVNQTIRVVYTKSNQTVTESYVFTPEAEKYTISTFFDLKFKLIDKEVSERFVETSIR